MQLHDGEGCILRSQEELPPKHLLDSQRYWHWHWHWHWHCRLQAVGTTHLVLCVGRYGRSLWPSCSRCRVFIGRGFLVLAYVWVVLVQCARGCLSKRRMSPDDGDFRTHSTLPLRALVTPPNSAFWSEFEHRPQPDPNIKTVCKYAFRIRM